MPSFLETPPRIQSSNQKDLTEIAYEIINVTEHFATNFQEIKASNPEMIDKIERLILENVMRNNTVKTETTSRVLQNGNNRLENESESSLKIIILLSVQQINAGQINASTEKFIAVNETSKSKEKKTN